MGTEDTRIVAAAGKTALRTVGAREGHWMNAKTWTAFGTALLSVMVALPAMAQSPVVPLDTLVATHGSITAGDVTFSNFQKPIAIPRQVEMFLFEFNDIGVSATAHDDGTVSLNFVGIDPATGLASPIVVGGAGPGEILRLVSYTATVLNPALRMHSLSQTYGPLTALVPGAGSLPFNFLFEVEPTLWAVSGSPYLYPLRDDYAQGTLPYQTLFPGGDLPTYNMENEFGILKGHTGVPAGATMDSISLNFTLVPVGTPTPQVAVNLSQAGDAVRGFGNISSWPNAFAIEPTVGVVQFFLTDFAQDGGAVISLTSDNPGAVPVPPTVTVAQGNFISPPLFPGTSNLDFPTTVLLTASFNGRTQTQTFTARPAMPLAIASMFAGTPQCGGVPCTLNASMGFSFLLNRVNVSPEVITLTSSLPAVCPIQPTLTLPALTPVGALSVFKITCTPVAVDTPITYTATLNGVTSTVTGTLFKTTDFAKINKAELVVKNLSLKVDATSEVPSDRLTLFNAATGQLIGTMTLTGTTTAKISGQAVATFGQYSFQGTISAPVKTLLLTTGLNGSTTFAVSQK